MLDPNVAVKHMEAQDAELSRLRAEVADLKRQKDEAYSERDRVVAALCATAVALGWPVFLGTHVGEWEDDWRNIIYIETPYGQVSWHYHDSERNLFWMHTMEGKPWDGHSTDKKYERLWSFVHDGVDVPWPAGRIMPRLAEEKSIDLAGRIVEALRPGILDATVIKPSAEMKAHIASFLKAEFERKTDEPRAD